MLHLINFEKILLNNLSPKIEANPKIRKHFHHTLIWKFFKMHIL